MENLFYGYIAGLLSECLTYPLDTIKTRKQRNVLTCHKHYYKGFLPIFIFSPIANTIYFNSYNETIQNVNNEYKYVIAGYVSTLCGSVIFTPVDVIKQNAQLKNQKITFTHYMKFISNKSIRNMYNGNAMSILYHGTYSALFFHIYNKMNDCLDPKYKNNLLSSMSAVTVSTLILSPFDIVKTYKQTYVTDKVFGYYQATQTVYQDYGLKGFFKGASFKVLNNILGTAITFSLFNYLIKKS